MSLVIRVPGRLGREQVVSPLLRPEAGKGESVFVKGGEACRGRNSQERQDLMITLIRVSGRLGRAQVSPLLSSTDR